VNKKKAMQFVYEKFEDTKGIIRISKTKNRKHNEQKKKDKKTSNNLQIIIRI